MKRFGILLALLCQILAGFGQEMTPGLRFRDADFETFARAFEEQTGIRLYYRPDFVNGLRVSVDAAAGDTLGPIRDVLDPAGLHFRYFPPDRVVIFPGHIPQVNLDFLRSGHERDRLQEEEQTANGEHYMETTQPAQLARVLVIGSPEQRSSRSAARILGRIRDAESGEPVTGATMVITETGKGAVSDQHGLVRMSLPPGRYNARFSFIGMESYACRMEVHSDGDFNVELQSTVIALNEVQIVGNHYRDINTTDVGVERLSMKSVKQMPLFMGENDVIKISRLLPGITSAGEASVGVNVRGGSADQNIFYINRVPVYNTSHMFGFLSAFNSDIVKDFSVYKGNVPVNYGGRLSSVFNIITRKGNQKRYTAHAGISPVSAHLTAEGPLVKEKVSMLVSGRTSYSDWMLRRMEDPMLRESNAGFHDLSGVLSASLNERNDLSAFYYQSADRFAYGDMSDYDYGNRGGSLVWKHLFSPAMSSTLTAAMSRYRFGHNDKYQVSQAYHHHYCLDHRELLAELTWAPAMNHHLELGGGLVHYGLDRGSVEPFGVESLRIPVNLGEEYGLEGSLFASDNYTILPWLTLYAGLRYSFFGQLGPASIRSYEAGGPKEEGTVTDSVSYGKNELVHFASGPEIRSALNIKTGPNTSMKLSFSQMRQYLFMLSNTITISPTDQWKLSDPHLKPMTGQQFTAGLYHVVPRWGLSASLELYYKHTDYVVEYKDGANFINSPFTETSVLQGEQKAFGLELMLQKSTGRVDGWVNYAFSRSMVQVTGEEDHEKINRGDPYPSNYDRPHVLNVIGSYHINRRFTISSNVVYMSGRPVTFPTSLYYINDYVYIDYYAKNQVRVPDYFRVDASISMEGNLKADKPFHSTWSLNVYNLLGRNNPQSIFFEPHENYLQGYSFSVIGVPIVTLSWNVKLGNYESD